MNNRMSAAMSASNSTNGSPTLNPVADRDFAAPKLPDEAHDTLQGSRSSLAPPSSLGWALHGGGMAADGVGLALSDTPAASAPSTAPGSPRM
jgi:hypothetical protein